MTKGIAFWILMLLWAVIAIHLRWPRTTPTTPAGEYLDTAIVFVLLFLLGWAVFGFAIQ